MLYGKSNRLQNSLLLNFISKPTNQQELLKIQISGSILKLKHGKEKQYEIQFNGPYNMENNHAIATKAYTITPQDIVIDLFRAEEEINFVHDQNSMGYQELVLNWFLFYQILNAIEVNDIILKKIKTDLLFVELY